MRDKRDSRLNVTKHGKITSGEVTIAVRQWYSARTKARKAPVLDSSVPSVSPLRAPIPRRRKTQELVIDPTEFKEPKIIASDPVSPKTSRK